jgi:ATP-dependent helicase/nuclease subunit B
VAATIYPKRISSTQSRIEKYMRCPFSHFCTYALRLHGEELADFDNNEIGNYVHTMLEEFFRDSEGKGRTSYSDAEIEELSQRISERYLERVGQGQQTSARMRHLWGNLRRSSKLLIKHIAEEFSQSDFTPRFFELEIGGKAADDPSPFVFYSEDGCELSIYGKVDRVDSYTADGKCYVRVIDYKTGTKIFRLADVRRGLNLQMLLYLFALWKNRNPAFAERLGVADGEKILPAGVLYMGAVTGEVKLERPTPEEEVLRLASDSARQNGLLLDDLGILRAMEHDLGGRFIPIKLNRDGTCSKESLKNLASLDRMGELIGEIGGILNDCTKSMRGGDISAYPTSYGESNCTFCEMRPICRARQSAERDEENG